MRMERNLSRLDFPKSSPRELEKKKHQKDQLGGEEGGGKFLK